MADQTVKSSLKKSSAKWSKSGKRKSYRFGCAFIMPRLAKRKTQKNVTYLLVFYGNLVSRCETINRKVEGMGGLLSGG